MKREIPSESLASRWLLIRNVMVWLSALITILHLSAPDWNCPFVGHLIQPPETTIPPEIASA
jgi:hypothetical protein